MYEPFIGEIMLFTGVFAPSGWMFCHGQLLPIRENTALFSILGTIYGGDGQTTFALPDLRGRVPMGFGQRPDFANVTLGERGQLSTHGSSLLGAMGINYCIATRGIYPSRS